MQPLQMAAEIVAVAAPAFDWHLAMLFVGPPIDSSLEAELELESEHSEWRNQEYYELVVDEVAAESNQIKLKC